MENIIKRRTKLKTIDQAVGAAASVYGSRGANGVILITLLSGKD